ncbi:hypothetical protein [Streptomyces chattanoogensis]|uniref:hypothetical protein n=1 Tax=Streptomyces chattanoogensis TaxID=66876 RepID=UPI00369B7AB6
MSVRGGVAVLKFSYRLVYWRRRIARAAGWRAGGRGPRRGRGRSFGREFVHRARPLLVSGVLVAIAVALSAVFAWADGPWV